MAKRPKSREDAKQATRDALVNAALAEFAEHGLDAPSLDAICARAGYTRGAFYVHFRDRDDLMVAVVQHAMGAFIDEVIAAGGDEAHDLERTIGRFADAVVRSLGAAGTGASPSLPLPASVPFARILEGVSRNPALRTGFGSLLGLSIERLRAITARGQQAGAVRPDLDEGAVATLLVIIALGVLVALDIGLPLDPPVLRATVEKLFAASKAPAVTGRASSPRRASNRRRR